MDLMTIFYNKRTGSIKELCSGIQTMEWFGAEKEDYDQIFDCLVVELDEYVLNNFTQFEIIEGVLKLKQATDLSKYR